MISRVFVTDLDGDDFVTFFIKVIHSKDTPAKKFHVNNTNATKFATFQISKMIRYKFRNLNNYICSYLTKL